MPHIFGQYSWSYKTKNMWSRIALIFSYIMEKNAHFFTLYSSFFSKFFFSPSSLWEGRWINDDGPRLSSNSEVTALSMHTAFSLDLVFKDVVCTVMSLIWEREFWTFFLCVLFWVYALISLSRLFCRNQWEKGRNSDLIFSTNFSIVLFLYDHQNFPLIAGNPLRYVFKCRNTILALCSRKRKL